MVGLRVIKGKEMTEESETEVVQIDKWNHSEMNGKMNNAFFDIVNNATGYMNAPVSTLNGEPIAAKIRRFDSVEEMNHFFGLFETYYLYQCRIDDQKYSVRFHI